jgi:hypothetical protein
MQMPPGSARLSSRAARLTPSPYILLAVDDHIAKVDADAKLHSAVGRQTCVLGLESVLNFDRAVHRLHHTLNSAKKLSPAIEFFTANIRNRNTRWHARGRSNSSSTWFDERRLELAEIEAITVAN